MPWGIDLLLPQVGGSARKTNYDYTDGNLPELIEIICESGIYSCICLVHSNVTPGCNLFISAVGVPPVWAVEKLHAKNILVMNMVGGTLFL